jgi:predicted nucleic acid-binding protein
VIQAKPAIIRAGLDLHTTNSVAVFDAVMLASAHAAGCNVIWTGDKNAGEMVTGVRISNPFA